MMLEFWKVVIYIFITFLVLMTIIGHRAYTYGKVIAELSTQNINELK
jgi:hypothetical protein